MKTKPNKILKQNVVSLVNKINREENSDRKAYQLVRLYLLILTIQNNYLVNKSDNSYYDDLFKSCVNLLTKYFNCNPMTLPSRILSTLGREVIPYFNAEDKVQTQHNLLYFDRQQASKFKIGIEEGQVFYQNSQRQFQAKDREFVFSFSGDIYINDGEIKTQVMGRRDPSSQTKHSSFLSGGEVLCAGMIKIVNNKIAEISNESGHYRPTHKDIAIFLNHLDSMGADLSTIQLKLHWPTLDIRADVFLSRYPELQLLKNTSFESHQEIRKNAAKLDKIYTLLKTPNDELSILFEIIENEQTKRTDAGKYEPSENNELADFLYNLWFENYHITPSSIESLTLLYKIDSISIIDKNYFENKLIENGFEALTQLAIDPDRNIEGEIYTASSENIDPQVIEDFLLNLKQYISKQPWETMFRVGLFGTPKPAHVQAIFNQINSFEEKGLDPIETYEKVLKIAQSAIDNPDWRRKASTQLFYEKLVTNELIAKFGPSPT